MYQYTLRDEYSACHVINPPHVGRPHEGEGEGGQGISCGPAESALPNSERSALGPGYAAEGKALRTWAFADAVGRAETEAQSKEATVRQEQCAAQLEAAAVTEVGWGAGSES